MRYLRNLLLAALGTITLVVIFALTLAGGYGFFGPPTPEHPVSIRFPGISVSATPTPSTSPSNADCGQNNPIQSGPVTYYANSPEAAPYRDFGPSLVPGLDPFYEPLGPAPDAQQVVKTTWRRYCTDPALTRAVTAVADPTWEGLNHPSNWTAGATDWNSALVRLSKFHWNQATMEYHSRPPAPWTMLMVAHGANAPPTTYLAHADHAGWFLKVPVDDTHYLLLRVGCGGQPYIMQDKDHSLLWKIFHIF